MADSNPNSYRMDISRCTFDGKLRIVYEGTPEALLAVGAITLAELAPIGRGKTRLDSNGDRCMVLRKPRGTLCVRLCKSEDASTLLPGVIAWINAEAGIPIQVCAEVTAILEVMQRSWPENVRDGRIIK